MSGSTIGAIAGAAVGFFIGGPQGAQYGWMIGSIAGGLIAPEQIDGPRLTDKSVQVSTYGAPIPIVYGSMRLAGNVIWTTDLVEHATEESAKGGPEVTTYSYTVSCAILLCEGPITGVRRIWANKRVVYDNGDTNTGVTTEAPELGRLRIHRGTEDQTADPLISAIEGVSPAYRGWAYVVIEDFDVSVHDGSRMPQFEFEVVNGSTSDIIVITEFVPAYTFTNQEMTGTAKPAASPPLIYAPDTGMLWVGAYDIEGFSTKWAFHVVDPATMATQRFITKNDDGYTFEVTGALVYSDGLIYYSPATLGNPSLAKLYSFNAATGVKSLDVVIGETGAEIYRLYVGRNNTLYAWGYGFDFSQGAYANQFAYINPVTGYIFWTKALIIDYARPYYPASAVMTSGGNFYACSTSYQFFNDDNKVLAEFNGLAGWNYVRNAYINDTYIYAVVYDTRRDAVWFSCGPNVIKRYDVATGAVTVAPNTAVLNWTAGFADDHETIYYDEHRDWIWHLANNTVYAYSLPDFVQVNQFTLYGTNASMMAITDGAVYVTHQSVGSPDGYAAVTKILPDRLSAGAVTLSTIVSDLCDRVGLPSSDINVSALTDEVDGYLIGGTMPARSAIEPLQAAYFFDGVESDDKLKFVKRGGAVAMSIPQDDRAASDDRGPVDSLKIDRRLEQEIPEEISVRYADVDADYLVSSQYERRITRYSDGTSSLDLPLAMNAQRAKKIAIVGLYSTWLRNSFTFATSLKYAGLEPTDVVSLPTDAGTYQARILTKKERAQGVIEWEAIAEDNALYSATGQPGQAGYVPQTLRVLQGTLLHLMDIPLLRDADDDPGFYLAASGAGGSGVWPGARIYKSTDAGVTYQEVTAITTASVIGNASTVLGDFSSGNIFDELNTVDVVTTGGQLVSATMEQVLNGANMALLGSEVIQFRTATLIDTNTYRLSGLLRGRRGSEYGMSTHVIADRFVLGSETAWRRMYMQTSEIGLERLYKAVTIGTRLSDAGAVAFMNTAVGLECYAPVHIGGGRNSSGDVTINWVRRARIDGAWRDYVDVALGEVSESYEIEIWDAAYVVLKRTITGLSSPTATYTAAQQTTDFGSTQSTVHIKIYQLSATVGRGFGVRGTI